MKPVFYLLTITALLIIIGCDDFSLLDQFSSDDDTPLELSIAKTTVENGETISLVPSGGTGPYSYSVIENDIFYSSSLGTFEGDTFTAGNSVGVLELIVEDASADTASAMLTVLPPPPEIQSVTETQANEATITWSYAYPERISGYLLYRIDPGNIEQQRASVSPATLNFADAVQPGDVYSYYLKAVAGSFISSKSAALQIDMAAQ